MKNSRKRCIFEHQDFIYVINFRQMITWVINDTDDDSPISTLQIDRLETNKWRFRTFGAIEMPFMTDTDVEFMMKLENNYQLYLSELIAGNNARLQRNNTIRLQDLHKTNLAYEAPRIHSWSFRYVP